MKQRRWLACMAFLATVKASSNYDQNQWNNQYSYDPRYGAPPTENAQNSDEKTRYSNAEENAPPPPPPQQQQQQQHQSYNQYYNSQTMGQQEYPPDQRQRRDQVTSEQAKIPIHYQFAAKEPKEREEEEDSGRRRGDRRRWRGRNEEEREEDDDIPVTGSEEELPSSYDQDEPKFASPRRDVITRYQSTSGGKIKLIMSTTMVGMSIGGFVGKSALNRPYSSAVGVGVLFWLLSLLRNAYGELSRALGMCFILALQRTSSIRRRYPTWPHVKSSLGVAPRRPFPRRDDRGEYQSVMALIAMGFMGSLCGGNLPVLPTWMGALLGAGLFVVSTTPNTAQGDLARIMGMRVVALVEEVLDINAELRVVQKIGVVSSKILDKILILDRKHRIKDRIVAGVTYVYDQVNRATRQDGEREEDDVRGEPRREESFGRRGDPDRRRRSSDEDDRRRRPDDRFQERNGRRMDIDRSNEPRYDRDVDHDNEDDYPAKEDDLPDRRYRDRDLDSTSDLDGGEVDGRGRDGRRRGLFGRR